MNIKEKELINTKIKIMIKAFNHLKVHYQLIRVWKISKTD